MSIDPAWKARVAASFAAAAGSYDAHAGLQRRAAAALVGLAAGLDLPSAPRMLELGCGTGLLTEALAAALPGLHGLVTDIAPPMLAACRARFGPAFLYAALDAEQPGLVSDRFDLLAAGLVAQWFTAPAASIRHLAGLLRPGGWMLLSLPAPGSLSRWGAASAAEGITPPILPFPDPERLRADWPGESQLVWQQIDLAYPTGRAFLAGLAGIGAGTPRPGHVTLNAGRLRRVIGRFEREFGAVADYRVGCLALRRGGAAGSAAMAE